MYTKFKDFIKHFESSNMAPNFSDISSSVIDFWTKVKELGIDLNDFKANFVSKFGENTYKVLEAKLSVDQLASNYDSSASELETTEFVNNFPGIKSYCDSYLVSVADKATNVTENVDVTAINDPKSLGTALKNVFKSLYNIKIDTRYVKTVRGLEGSWYEISTFKSGDIIPNEVRKELLEITHPGKTLTDLNISNVNDIYYGNIRGERLAVYGRDWKTWLATKNTATTDTTNSSGYFDVFDRNGNKTKTYVPANNKHEMFDVKVKDMHHTPSSMKQFGLTPEVLVLNTLKKYGNPSTFDSISQETGLKGRILDNALDSLLTNNKIKLSNGGWEINETFVSRPKKPKFDITQSETSLASAVAPLIAKMDTLAFPDLKNEFTNILKNPEVHASEATRRKWSDVIVRATSKFSLMNAITNLYLKAARLGITESNEKGGWINTKIYRKSDMKEFTVNDFKNYGSYGEIFAKDNEGNEIELTVGHPHKQTNSFETNFTTQNTKKSVNTPPIIPKVKREMFEAVNVTVGSLNDLISRINAEGGGEFSLSGAYGEQELWAKDKDGGSHRIECGSKKDIYQALIKNRYNKKYNPKYAEDTAK